VTLTSSVPTGDRFDKHLPVAKQNGNNEQCVRFLGTLGGRWPTPQRGSWFSQDGDVEALRQKIRDACPADQLLVRVYPVLPD
jgi:hypothetical protein